MLESLVIKVELFSNSIRTIGEIESSVVSIRSLERFLDVCFFCRFQLFHQFRELDRIAGTHYL